MDELKLFHDGCEWVVAGSHEDASRVVSEHTGEKFDSLSLGGGGVHAESAETRWELWPEGKALTIIEENGSKTTLMPFEWVKQGRAYLGSTEV